MNVLYQRFCFVLSVPIITGCHLILKEIGTTELLARGVNLSVLAIGEVNGRLHSTWVDKVMLGMYCCCFCRTSSKIAASLALIS